MQYALIAVVAIGMLVVVLISARNYSPTEWIILAFFIVIIMIVGGNYFLNTDIAASIKNIASRNPQIKLDLVKRNGSKQAEDDKTKTTKGHGKDQVFHVPGQYNYTDARALCRAYGGSLANIKQMYQAYKDGAEWCDYGWSEDQMALYPTQTKTWQAFKESELNKEDCGRPGVNGGYTMDLNQLLGVNCFGPKPSRNGKKIQEPPYPPDPLDEKSKKYEDNLPNVSSFNYEKWNE